MKRTAVCLAAVLFTAVFAGSAKAIPVVFTTTLSGASEVPPVSPAGTGLAIVTLDAAAHSLRVQVTFSGLTSGTVASHIHCCQPIGTNAIVATTTPTFPNFPLGVTSGTYDMTFDLTQASSYNPAFITAHGGTVAQAEADFVAGVLAGQSYLNVHTANNQGGEIRGQLLQTPEPTSLLLLGTGVAGLIGAIRRKRKAQT